MQVNEYKANLFGQECELHLMDFDEKDKKQWKILFNYWRELSVSMKEYGARGINFPEGLSEVAFCLFSGSKRFVSIIKGNASASFDTFNLKRGRAEQIKACSVKKDMTSFGPNSKWDDLYFMDFYRDGKWDGSCDIYLIPNDLIKNVMVNKKQTFTDMQSEGKRPRFSIKEKIIQKEGLKPMAEGVKVWL